MTPQRIKEEAEALKKEKSQYHYGENYLDGLEDGYIAGATAENECAQGLVDALEYVIHAPATWDKTQLLAWIDSVIAKSKEALAKWKGEGEQ